MIYIFFIVFAIAWFVTSLVILIKEGKTEIPPKKKTLLIINMIFASIAFFFAVCLIALAILGMMIVANM
ncbi:MAG: hypothetical protein KBT48_09645 [Firmicutes bacterium]|nr:hypothetical protein [Bacillota bacterium]